MSKVFTGVEFGNKKNGVEFGNKKIKKVRSNLEQSPRWVFSGPQKGGS